MLQRDPANYFKAGQIRTRSEGHDQLAVCRHHFLFFLPNIPDADSGGKVRITFSVLHRIHHNHLSHTKDLCGHHISRVREKHIRIFCDCLA